MGVRLYPMTKNPDVLAKLLGISRVEVMFGEKYYEVEADFKAKYTGNDDPGYVFYSEVGCVLPGVFAAKDFDLFGWGHLASGVYPFLKAYGHDYVAGHTTEPEQVRMILAAQGVDLHGVTLEELEGINWG